MSAKFESFVFSTKKRLSKSLWFLDLLYGLISRWVLSFNIIIVYALVLVSQIFGWNRSRDS